VTGGLTASAIDKGWLGSPAPAIGCSERAAPTDWASARVSLQVRVCWQDSASASTSAAVGHRKPCFPSRQCRSRGPQNREHRRRAGAPDCGGDSGAAGKAIYTGQQE